jgi:hypothetical protein
MTRSPKPGRRWLWRAQCWLFGHQWFEVGRDTPSCFTVTGHFCLNCFAETYR